MPKKKTVLVLGAGASAPYGFPVGAGLKRRILGLPTAMPDVIAKEFRDADLAGMIKVFHEAGHWSIDAFLGQRQEFQRVGKLAIAHIILGYENRGHLLSPPVEDDDWMLYLVNALFDDHPDKLDLSWLTIVTFNYDRSVETRLALAAQARYRMDDDAVKDFLRRIAIHHVYGDLGDIFDRDEPFNHLYAANWDRVERAAARLRVIPEGRNDDPSLLPIQAALRNADQIAFLGFGYDRENLERLGLPLRHPVVGLKFYCGTSRGLTPAQGHVARSRIAQDFSHDGNLWRFNLCSEVFTHIPGLLAA